MQRNSTNPSVYFDCEELIISPSLHQNNVGVAITTNPNFAYYCVVKWLVKIASVFVVITVYCFAMGVSNESHTSAKSQRDTDSFLDQSNHDVSSELYTHSFQLVEFEDSFDNSNLRNYKKSSGGNINVLSNWNVLLAFQSSQATPVTREVLLKRTKSDLIFPFHHFS